MKPCNFKYFTLCRLQTETSIGYKTNISNYHECCGEDECVLYSIYKHLYREKESFTNKNINNRKHD